MLSQNNNLRQIVTGVCESVISENLRWRVGKFSVTLGFHSPRRDRQVPNDSDVSSDVDEGVNPSAECRPFPRQKKMQEIKFGPSYRCEPSILYN